METERFLQKKNKFAVVGATRNREKWGYKVYKKLKGAFPGVYPVNPNYRKIEGEVCYPDLRSLPEKPDVVITVVPPQVTESVVRECRKLGIARVWMQPGSESKEALEFCRRNRMECVHDMCFVVDGLKQRFD